MEWNGQFTLVELLLETSCACKDEFNLVDLFAAYLPCDLNLGCNMGSKLDNKVQLFADQVLTRCRGMSGSIMAWRTIVIQYKLYY